MKKIENKNKLISKREFWRQQRLENKAKYRRLSRGSIRLTENEKAYLTKTAAENGYDFTTYVLENSLYTEINVVNLEFLKEHTSAINRLGNNINQITRQLNIAVNSGALSKSDIDEFKASLLQETDIVKELYKLNQKIHIKLQHSLIQKKLDTYNENYDYVNEDQSNMDTNPCLIKK